MPAADAKISPWIENLFWLLLLALLLFLRRPEAILHAQFWAEDGRMWFANAYNSAHPWGTLLRQQDGYLQTLSRLVSLLSLLFSLQAAPLVFNIGAFLVNLLPSWFLLGSRLSNIIPEKKIRVALALALILLPNTAEVQGNLTNAQWYLALLGCLVLLSLPSQKVYWKIFDAAAIILSALSGPFALFLLPVALIVWYKRKTVWPGILSGLLLACAAAQSVILFFISPRGNRARAIGSWKLFWAILNRQIFLGPILGLRGYLWALQYLPFYHVIFIFTTIVGVLFLAYAAFFGPLELKLFLLFAVLVFAASLLNPSGVKPPVAWKVFSLSYAGLRYWLIPMAAFLAVLVFCAKKQSHLVVKILARIFLIAMLFGIVMDFRYPALVNYQFAAYAKNFVRQPAGSKIVIPINPPGWGMQLIKR